jgi:hypothetical protein
MIILAWLFGLALVGVAWWRAFGADTHLDDVEFVVPLDLYRAKCDEVGRLERRVAQLEALVRGGV